MNTPKVKLVPGSVKGFYYTEDRAVRVHAETDRRNGKAFKVYVAVRNYGTDAATDVARATTLATIAERIGAAEVSP